MWQVTETFLLGEAVVLTFWSGPGLENAHEHMDITDALMPPS